MAYQRPDLEVKKHQRPDLEVKKLRGGGFNGTVFEGTYCGTDVAIKVVGYRKNPQGMPKAAIDDFQNEYKKMESCRHENIVQYMKTVDGGITLDGVTYLALVMTLMKTDLKSFLNHQTAPLPVHKEIKIAHDIAKALHYLHDDVNIFHGDLHCGNVLLSQVSAIEGPSVKLCDFGFARSISNLLDKHPSLTLSSENLSDERESPNRSYREYRNRIQASPISHDIIHFGIVMWEIHMFPGQNDDKIDRCLGFPEDLVKIEHRQLYNVVEMCWQAETPKANDLVRDLENMKESIPIEDPKDKRIKELEQELAKLKFSGRKK